MQTLVIFLNGRNGEVKAATKGIPSDIQMFGAREKVYAGPSAAYSSLKGIIYQHI